MIFSFVLQIFIVVDPLQESLGIRAAVGVPRGPAAAAVITARTRVLG